MRKSSGHVIGVPVTSKAYALEEAAKGAGACNKDGTDRLAVSLTHPSPYSSFGYKHSTSLISPSSFFFAPLHLKIPGRALIKSCARTLWFQVVRAR